MRGLAYVYDELFLRHQPGAPHPERPERALAVRDALVASGVWERGRRLPARAARRDELTLVHAADYVDELARTLPGNHGYLDSDTYFSPDTWDAALSAAGSAIDLALEAVADRSPRGFAAVRPPGHHAGPDQAMGFCLLNNAALAAAAARAAGCDRVAIVDWDVHHGNGTQAIFWRDPTVMYLSAHQYPYYPGTGASEDTGEGPGRGTTVNVPLPAGAGDEEILAAATDVFAPALRAFRPALIVASAGFDAYEHDPLGGLRVTALGYRRLAGEVRRLADELCGGRLVCVLEGGYDLEGLRDTARAAIEVLAAAQAPSSERSHSERILPAARAAIESTRAAIAAAGTLLPGRSIGVQPLR